MLTDLYRFRLQLKHLSGLPFLEKKHFSHGCLRPVDLGTSEYYQDRENGISVHTEYEGIEAEDIKDV